MKTLTTILLTAGLTMGAFAQQYKIENSEIIFESTAEKEDITAANTGSIGVIDFGSNKFSFKVTIMDFIFPNELMQEHFNENYMESEDFPSATYKGELSGNVDLEKDGDYRVVTKGELKIHGVTKKVSIPGVITVKGGNYSLYADFPVKPKDYKIKIPNDMSGNIAEELKVTIKSDLVVK